MFADTLHIFFFIRYLVNLREDSHSVFLCFLSSIERLLEETTGEQFIRCSGFKK